MISRSQSGSGGRNVIKASNRITAQFKEKSLIISKDIHNNLQATLKNGSIKVEEIRFKKDFKDGDFSVFEKKVEGKNISCLTENLDIMTEWSSNILINKPLNYVDKKYQSCCIDDITNESLLFNNTKTITPTNVKKEDENFKFGVIKHYSTFKSMSSGENSNNSSLKRYSRRLISKSLKKSTTDEINTARRIDSFTIIVDDNGRYKPINTPTDLSYSTYTTPSDDVTSPPAKGQYNAINERDRINITELTMNNLKASCVMDQSNSTFHRNLKVPLHVFKTKSLIISTSGEELYDKKVNYHTNTSNEEEHCLSNNVDNNLKSNSTFCDMKKSASLLKKKNLSSADDYPLEILSHSRNFNIENIQENISDLGILKSEIVTRNNATTTTMIEEKQQIKERSLINPTLIDDFRSEMIQSVNDICDFLSQKINNELGVNLVEERLIENTKFLYKFFFISCREGNYLNKTK
uniref:Ras GEF n=1 Tax=Strongyloides venezuelensis TaxID=75913 RepID=A0A0K0FI96_STRVS